MTKAFIVERTFTGYVRGTRYYRVMASSEQEAEELVLNGQGEFVEDEIVRNDTDLMSGCSCSYEDSSSS